MWVRLDDCIAGHPKFVRAGVEAFALFVAGLCYCNRYSTGGLIPMDAVGYLLPGVSGRRATELAERLTANGERPSWVVEGDAYRVHDYEVYQFLPDGDRSAVKKANNAARQQRFRDRHAAPGVTPDAPRHVTRYVTRYVTPEEGVISSGAQRYGEAKDNAESDAGERSRITEVTPGRNAPLPTPLPLSPPEPVQREFSIAPAREERDVAADFEVWAKRYPRQQAYVLGLEAFQAVAIQGALPALPNLLEALDAQVEAEADPRWWRRMDRYVYEQGWLDQPLPSASRSRGSRGTPTRRQGRLDSGRRQRLKEILEGGQARGENADE